MRCLNVALKPLVFISWILLLLITLARTAQAQPSCICPADWYCLPRDGGCYKALCPHQPCTEYVPGGCSNFDFSCDITGSCDYCSCYDSKYDCRGCTPTACPAGQSETNPGAPEKLCLGNKYTCRGEDGCPDEVPGDCTISRQCYYDETNVAPPAPSQLQICYYEGDTNPEFPNWSNGDGASCDTISTNAANPTIVRENFADYDSIFIKSPIVSEPAGSNTQGVRYLLGIGGLTSGWQMLPYLKVNDTGAVGGSSGVEYGSSRVESVDTGDGSDGAITVNADTDINTTNLSGKCPDGDAASYNVISLGLSSATLASTPSAGCLQNGDQVLLINVGGTMASVANVGNYEVLTVQSQSGTTVNFSSAKTKYYGAGVSDDTGLGTTFADQKVMLQRIPQYTNVTVAEGATLHPTAYNGVKGGVLYFKASGNVIVNGNIDATGYGYPGGIESTWYGDDPATAGWGAFYTNAVDGSAGRYNVRDVTKNSGHAGTYSGGGGGNIWLCKYPPCMPSKWYYRGGGLGSSIPGASGGGAGAGMGGTSSEAAGYGGGGGGGGHITPGLRGNSFGVPSMVSTDGTYVSSGQGSGSGKVGENRYVGAGGGGAAFGDVGYEKLIMGGGGGGGGAGGLDNSTDGRVRGGAGGGGGGIVIISANYLNINGLIKANGENGGVPIRRGTGLPDRRGGGGGGGAGGTLKIEANTIYIGGNGVSASKGVGGYVASNGGYGGDGGEGVANINYTTLLVDNRRQWVNIDYDWASTDNPYYLSQLIDGYDKTAAAAGSYSFLNEYDIIGSSDGIDLNIPNLVIGLESEATIEVTFQSSTIDRCDYDILPGGEVKGYLSLLGAEPPIPEGPEIDPVEPPEDIEDIDPENPQGGGVLDPSTNMTWIGSTSNPDLNGVKLSNNPMTLGAKVIHNEGLEKVKEVRLDIARNADNILDEDLRIILSIDGGTYKLGYVEGDSSDIQQEVELDQNQNIYYLREDISRDGDNEFVINKDNTLVTNNGIELNIYLNITFVGDKSAETERNDKWEGVHYLLWSAMDEEGIYDTSGQYVERTDGTVYQRSGVVTVDFTPPVAESKFSLTECDSLSSLEACWVMNITEIEEYDSGIYYLDGVKYTIWPNEETTTIGDINLHENEGDPWLTEYEYVYKITKDDVEQVAGVLVDRIFDRVGNVLAGTIKWEPERYPWVRAIGTGDVYGAEGFSNNILAEYPEGTGMYMSSYWLGGGGSQEVFDFTPGTGSLLGWVNNQYDNNTSYKWYDQLKALAVGSVCAELEDDACEYQTGTSVATRLDDPKGIYLINLSDAEEDTETLVAGSVCSGGDKVIFITGGTLQINPNFTSEGGSHCMFISDEDVVILPGQESGGTLDTLVDPPVVVKDTYDVVEASFIVDDTFEVEDDGDERIEITGMVVAGNTEFLRSLPVAANRELPAVLIRYSPLHLVFDDVIEQRLYHQFECGIYDDIPSCSNWE